MIGIVETGNQVTASTDLPRLFVTTRIHLERMVHNQRPPRGDHNIYTTNLQIYDLDIAVLLSFTFLRMGAATFLQARNVQRKRCNSGFRLPLMPPRYDLPDFRRDRDEKIPPNQRG